MVETPVPTRSMPPWARHELVSAEEVRRSYAYCRKVARRRARNFYYGLMLTPAAKRAALYAIYGFMRACDDLADSADPCEARQGHQKLARIEAFRCQMDQIIREQRLPPGTVQQPSVWPAFLDVVQRYL